MVHEIGTVLGSPNDGVSQVSDSCPSSLNYIMSPSTIAITNPLNQYLFSSCSITSIKSTLLISNNVPYG